MENILESHKSSIGAIGFWTEQYKEIVINHIESLYKEEYIKGFRISDFTINGDKVLIKWSKSIQL